VVAAGKAGISGRKVAEATGIHYPRVVRLMDKSFKKTGERKWSRYHAK
jgi:predicted XRE-type DNA-binding protein